MSLEIYLRNGVFWVRGRPADGERYRRASLRTSDAEIAASKRAEIELKARQRAVLGSAAPKPEDELTFRIAALLYNASRRDRLYLVPLVRRYGKMLVREMTPEFIRQIGPQAMPRAAADTWQRQIVTPIRAVINNAHALGKCPPIRVPRYTEAERVRQDVARGQQSREPRGAGSWPWLLAFVEHAQPRDAALAWFMFRHGYRLSQSIAATRSRDLDLSAGRLRVHASKGHPAHWVQLDPEEVAMIANLPVPWRGQARDRVFTIAGGRSGALYRRWQATCKAAGIAYLPPHQCGRHGYGTEMIVRRGIDPVTASDSKWADPSVMLKTYAHAEDAAAKIAAEMRAGLTAARTQRVQPPAGKNRKAMK